MFPDGIPWPFIVVGLFILLLVVGVAVDVFWGRKEGKGPQEVRRRARFVRTVARMTMRLRRGNRRDEDEDARPQ